jgi:cytidylate kinase
MANILLKYFLEKFDTTAKPLKEPGPVVTISREFGCSGNDVAASLCKLLNKKNENRKFQAEWKSINKEVIEKSAKELNLHDTKISKFFNDKQKSTIDDILSTFLDSNYKNDIKIKKTIAEVVKSFANDGYKVIIGRGGVALTQHIPDALQIKLYAPLEWRVSKIQLKFHITEEEARKLTLETDKQRQALNDYFFKKKTDNSIYDLIINTETFSIDEVAEIIANAMKLKKIGLFVNSN